MAENIVWTDSVLQSIIADNIHQEEVKLRVSNEKEELLLSFQPSQVYFMTKIEEEIYFVSSQVGVTSLAGCEHGWILPLDGQEEMGAIEIKTTGSMVADCRTDGVTVRIKGMECTLVRHASRPHADFYGNQYSFSFQKGEMFEKTLAEFYWGTLLPSVIERTKAVDYPIWRGYVVSTLQPGEYAGTYPDVDHEFQCKGRLALSGGFELDVVKRMMELQFKLMKEDPIHLWRNPCAIQPNGIREYHVRRNSLDRTANAEMFLVTGNIEVLETAWLYIAATKDLQWLGCNIENLEGAASLVEHLTDGFGRLWSDVYYEDQIIKDGMECMSAAMAANAYGKLADLEDLLGRKDKSQHYKNQEKRLAEAMVKPYPMGFWDEDKNRFVDWIDRNGQVHDHIHLLANSLPVLFSYTSKDQEIAVDQLIKDNIEELQRFPTFLSSCIDDYTDSEIGDGGPYDLCAAGRYWCWDAAYWSSKKDGAMLFRQLCMVAEQAESDHYKMGERYDMNHVYYQSNINWHGAPYYYEYPCVFSWVLIHDYLGITHDLKGDLSLTPRLTSYGKVAMDSYQVEYEYTPEGFRVKNLSAKTRSFRISLEVLYPGKEEMVISLPAGEEILIKK